MQKLNTKTRIFLLAAFFLPSAVLLSEDANDELPEIYRMQTIRAAKVDVRIDGADKKCPKCNGTGYVECVICNGRILIPWPNVYQKQMNRWCPNSGSGTVCKCVDSGEAMKQDRAWKSRYDIELVRRRLGKSSPK